MGQMHPAGTEAGIYDVTIAQLQTTKEADDLINHLESEMKKTKSPALKRRLEMALEGTRQRKQQLQTAVESKSRPVKPRQLFMGHNRKIVDNRPLVSPPPTGDEDASEATH
jgi:ferritin-like metal-binding protein YciE